MGTQVYSQDRHEWIWKCTGKKAVLVVTGASFCPAVAHPCSPQISTSGTWAAVSAHSFSSAWLYYLLVMTILYLLSHEMHF